MAKIIVSFDGVENEYTEGVKEHAQNMVEWSGDLLRALVYVVENVPGAVVTISGDETKAG